MSDKAEALHALLDEMEHSVGATLERNEHALCYMTIEEYERSCPGDEWIDWLPPEAR